MFHVKHSSTKSLVCAQGPAASGNTLGAGARKGLGLRLSARKALGYGPAVAVRSPTRLGLRTTLFPSWLLFLSQKTTMFPRATLLCMGLFSRKDLGSALHRF